MYSRATYDRVVEIVRGQFELDHLVFGPESDIVAMAKELADPELAEWAIESIEREFDMSKPAMTNKRGQPRIPVMFIPETLIVAELCEVVETGAWPDAWTRPGKYLSPFVAWMLGLKESVPGRRRGR